MGSFFKRDFHQYFYCFSFYHSYPPRYIHNRLKKFFTNHFKTSSLQPSFDNIHNFEFNRSYLLNRPTITEHHIASRIANDLDNQEHNTVDDPLVRVHLKKKSKWTTNLIVRYTYEARLESYKKNIHQLWNQIFAQTPVMNTSLIISSRNNGNSKGRLVHRRPYQNNHR